MCFCNKTNQKQRFNQLLSQTFESLNFDFINIILLKTSSEVIYQKLKNPDDMIIEFNKLLQIYSSGQELLESLSKPKSKSVFVKGSQFGASVFQLSEEMFMIILTPLTTDWQLIEDDINRQNICAGVRELLDTQQSE